jgi:gluconate 5-dehydrogenase
MNIKEMFDISGKVAIVTGGGRGIGKAIAEVYGEAGAKVVITGRREQWLDPAVEEFKSKGYDALAIKADVSQEADIDRTVKTTLEKYGKIDILVNNAGQTWGAPTVEHPLEKYRQVMDVNMTGIFILTQQVGRHMIERGEGGNIINITSIKGIMTLTPEVHSTIGYDVSKGALITFTRSVAREWGRYNIRVNAIAPGWFPTRMASGTIQENLQRFNDQAALGRVGDLEELKGAALFLASPASSYITGIVLPVDGGTSI